MSANELSLLARVAKSLQDLKVELRALAREPGPSGDKGDKGDKGPPGKNGIDGKKGDKGLLGKNGIDGKRGADGKKGDKGLPGKKGDKGDPGPVPKHEWRGTELRFQTPEKKWGKWVELRGAPGSGGGVVAIGSDSSWSPDDLPEATDDTPQAFVVKQGGAWVQATYEQMQSWFPSLSTPPDGVWLLDDGTWSDGGYWFDTSTWNDGV